MRELKETSELIECLKEDYFYIRAIFSDGSSIRLCSTLRPDYIDGQDKEGFLFDIQTQRYLNLNTIDEAIGYEISQNPGDIAPEGEVEAFVYRFITSV